MVCGHRFRGTVDWRAGYIGIFDGSNKTSRFICWFEHRRTVRRNTMILYKAIVGLAAGVGLVQVAKLFQQLEC
jgi:hypothetical protein